MRTNYVLVDYENVQPEFVGTLNQENVKILVFVGASQPKIPFELAVALQQMGERAQYVKIAGNGNNALDFHIAFYLGQLVIREPSAYFHIISKDTGFDPLVQYLRNKKFFVHRWSDVGDIPIFQKTGTGVQTTLLKPSIPLSLSDSPMGASAEVRPPTTAAKPIAAKPTAAKPTTAKPTATKPTTAKPTATKPARIARIVQDLQKRGKSKPASVQTLTGTINALFAKKLSEQEIQSLLKELQRQGIVTVNGTKVSYTLT